MGTVMLIIKPAWFHGNDSTGEQPREAAGACPYLSIRSSVLNELCRECFQTTAGGFIAASRKIPPLHFKLLDLAQVDLGDRLQNTYY